ncbi:unnamed protein product, partial [Prunus brigantina]
GISGGAIAGICVAGVSAALILALLLYAWHCKRKVVEAPFLSAASEDRYIQHVHVSGHSSEKTLESVALVGASSPGLTGITVDKSVEFSYEELAKATSDFNIANKIGQGGFGAVYYAELRGEVCVLASMFHPQSFL